MDFTTIEAAASTMHWTCLRFALDHNVKYREHDKKTAESLGFVYPWKSENVLSSAAVKKVNDSKMSERRKKKKR